MFSKLLENPDYRDYFLRQLKKYLGTTLSEAHVLHKLEEQLEIVRPVIAKEAERWAQDKRIDDWEHAAQLARDFISKRTAVVRRHVYQALGAPQPTPTPVVVTHVREWTVH